MRYSYTYKIDSTQKLINKLVAKSKLTNHISILLSNQEGKKKGFPKKYINYDLIAGIEKLTEIESKKNSFQELRKFHSQHLDWMFGYLSYDLKNEIEELVSQNQDGIKAKNISFFIPKYVFLLKGNDLEVLTFQVKKTVDQFLQSLSLLKLSNIHQIILKQKD